MRASFADAAVGLVELTSQVPAGAWGLPALGEWDIRALVGHASRALSTVESYLGRPGEHPTLDGPVAYFCAALPEEADPERRRQLDRAIADRGRQSGAELGENPAAAVAEMANRVCALVDTADDDAPVATAVGAMTLAGYLPTRTFELAVHSLDLARALALPVPATMGPAIAASCELAGRLAAQRPDAADLLLLLTGRSHLRDGLSVV
ncbi:MAG: maleylpyruvate isomerase N-terminal domain-containing protein [Acidimicrobiales bacterium]